MPHTEFRQSAQVTVQRFGRRPEDLVACDEVVIEEPFEIRLEYLQQGTWQKQSVTVTLRTPGDDEDLAIGFLRSEGILRSIDELDHMQPCGNSAHGANILRVVLKPGVIPDIQRSERNFAANASCGLCGKTSLEAVQIQGLAKIPRESLRLSAALIPTLPSLMLSAQRLFHKTGAIHAAALIDAQGRLLASAEDIGRHNAVDKVIGALLRQGCLDLSELLMVVSGRAGFELVQKALAVGIPALCAIGAPSSLSIAMAEAHDMTLIGFMRESRFNVYTGAWRIHE